MYKEFQNIIASKMCPNKKHFKNCSSEKVSFVCEVDWEFERTFTNLFDINAHFFITIDINKF